MNIDIGKPARGAGDQASTQIAARAITLTWAWGVNPSPGAVTYVSSGEYPPVTAGAWVQMTLFGRTFYGIVKGGPVVLAPGISVPTSRGSDGNEMRLDFVDTRLYLAWDRVFGTFNNVETRLVAGKWRKRYWHVLPDDFERWHKTYTTMPYSAAQILDAIFSSSTVGSPWQRIYHNDQSLPYNQVVDCSGGRALNEVVQEICDTQGLTLTVSGGPYRLVFARKGDGPVPTFPANSDQHRLELSLSEAPTRVFVVGDRNLYLLLNVAMQPDWNRRWEEVLTPEELAADLFWNESDRTLGPYKTIPGDTDNARGWQLATARALEITVREYAALRKARPGGGEPDFTDQRKFATRSRMDMPASLYLRSILFRAFRPPEHVVINGQETPLTDVRLVSEQVAFVTHDIVTGVMTAQIDPPEGDTFSGGNGYAIAKGYNLGADIFRMVQPDRFNIDDFVESTNLWQPMTYSIDESGEGSQFVLFDQPIINTADLVAMVDGFAVIKANPVLRIPEVMAALTFEGGKFIYTYGVGSRDDVLNVSGLRAEWVVGQEVTEVPFADGFYSAEKAEQLAETYLAKPWVYRSGGYRIALGAGEVAPTLLATMGRLTLEQSAQGNFATVEFEQDRPIRHYVPETLLDRQVRMHSVLPGQQELRAEAHAHKLLAVGLRESGMVQLAQAYLQGRIGDGTPTHVTSVKSGAGAFPVGTPLWRTPTLGSRPPMPAATTTEHKQFVGVVVRDGERANGLLQVQRSGTVLARVKGPVAVGEAVAASPGNAYLVKKVGDAPAVGTAQMAVASTEKLIHVQVGASTGGSTRAVWA